MKFSLESEVRQLSRGLSNGAFHCLLKSTPLERG